jgi:TonB family protein
MQTAFLLYLLQASGCMAVVYLLYRILLRRETFFSFNRWFLLGGVALAAVLPLVKFPAPATPLYAMPAIQLDTIDLLQAQPGAQQFDWAGLLVELYEVGMFLFAVRLLYRVYHIWELTRQLPGEPREGYLLLHTGGSMPTFSFFGWLFWDETNKLSETERDQMMRHEEAHIRQRHSVDVLLTEVVGIFFWFNPVIYLFGRDLRAVHEYLADREVVKSGGDTGTYVKLVAGQALQGLKLALIQPFQSPPLKNRLRMIRRGNAGPTHRWKAVVTLCTLGILTVLYACQTVELIEPLQDDARVAELMPAASPEFVKELSKTIMYPASARAEGLTGTVTSSFVIRKDGSLADIRIEKGIREDIDSEVLRTLHATQAKWKPGTPFQGATDIRVSFPFHFIMDSGTGLVETPVGGVVVVGYSTRSSVPPPVTPLFEEDVFIVVEQMPEFTGGMDGLTKYLSEHLKYPVEARNKNVQGTVFVSFVVQADGSITDVNILKGIGAGCDTEASRVVAEMPAWQPGRQNDKPVPVSYTLPIRFVLN